jgi:hypothetical protein
MSISTFQITVDEAKLLIDMLEYSDSVGDDRLGDDECALLDRLRAFVAKARGMA